MQAHGLLLALDSLRADAVDALDMGTSAKLDSVLEKALQLGVRADMDHGPDSVSMLIRRVAERRMAAARAVEDASMALRHADREQARACLHCAQEYHVVLEPDVKEALEALVRLTPAQALQLRLEQAGRSGSVAELARATAAAKAIFF